MYEFGRHVNCRILIYLVLYPEHEPLSVQALREIIMSRVLSVNWIRVGVRSFPSIVEDKVVRLYSS